VEAKMCIGIPARIVEISGFMARGEVGGVIKELSLALLPGVKVGDFVIVHAGFALTKVDEEEAQKTLDFVGKLTREIYQ